MPNRGLIRKVRRHRAAFPNAKLTSGGSSDTELKELIVTAIGSPAGSRLVARATPVGKHPNAFRNSRALVADTESIFTTSLG